YQQLRRVLAQEGYPAYRLGIQSMSDMNAHSGYTELLRALKKTLDPQHVLAPGRYQPVAAHSTSAS
ncbi:MAG: hypothetical protein ACRD7E_20015, partial [Bryobacteraceae bacterium]